MPMTLNEHVEALLAMLDEAAKTSNAEAATLKVAAIREAVFRVVHRADKKLNDFAEKETVRLKKS